MFKSHQKTNKYCACGQARPAHKWLGRGPTCPLPPCWKVRPGREFHFFVFCKTRTVGAGRARGVGLAADSPSKTKPVSRDIFLVKCSVINEKLLAKKKQLYNAACSLHIFCSFYFDAFSHPLCGIQACAWGRASGCVGRG